MNKDILALNTLKLDNGITMCSPRENNHDEYFIWFLYSDNLEEVDGGSAYWDVAEWKEDPECVLGAIFAVITNDNKSVFSGPGDVLVFKNSNHQNIVFPSYKLNPNGVDFVNIEQHDGRVLLNEYKLNDFIDNPVESMSAIVDAMSEGNENAGTMDFELS